jgi:hypothetical protein
VVLRRRKIPRICWKFVDRGYFRSKEVRSAFYFSISLNFCAALFFCWNGAINCSQRFDIKIILRFYNWVLAKKAEIRSFVFTQLNYRISPEKAVWVTTADNLGKHSVLRCIARSEVLAKEFPFDSIRKRSGVYRNIRWWSGPINFMLWRFHTAFCFQFKHLCIEFQYLRVPAYRFCSYYLSISHGRFGNL